MEAEAYVTMAAAEQTHWWFRGRRRVLRAVIARLGLPAAARILELGSGTGGNLAMLGQFGRVTAVEMDQAAREMCLARLPGLDVRPGRAPDDLPLAGEMFDLICLFDMLEHVDDDAGTLAAMVAHLAPGGALLVTVPAFAWLWGPHDESLHHKRRYGRAELHARLAGAGFRVERLSFINMALFPLAVALRLYDRSRGGASGTGMPPGPVNALFAALFGAEAWALRWVSLPVGLSLLAVARKG